MDKLIKSYSLPDPDRLTRIKLPRVAFRPDHKGYKNCIECEKATVDAQLQHDRETLRGK